MGADPGYLCLKQSDPLGQFVLRIGIEQFLRQRARRIAFGPTAEVLADPKVKAAYLGTEEVAQ